MYIHSSLEPFIQRLIQEGKKSSTIKSYKFCTSLFIKYLVEQGIDVFNYTTEDVLNFLKHEDKRGLSNRTIRKFPAAINAFSQFLNVAAEINLSDIDFLKEQETNLNTVIVLHKEAQEKIYQYAPKVFNKRNISIVLLILETGIKLSELVALNKEDLQKLNGGSYVTINSKDKRTLPISENLYSYIQSTISKRLDHSVSLFVSSLKTRISDRTVSSIISSYGELTSQILRDTYIYNLIENDTETYLIAQLAGLKNANLVVNYYNRNYLFINEFYDTPASP